MHNPNRLYQRFLLAALLVACWTAVGCQQSDVESLSTEYGKINGVEGGVSLNGTSVLADMFSIRGFRVKRRSKISPRIERYQTLVWFPDTRACPDPEVTDAINTWLDNGYDRTFIYVGRDYNARSDYLYDVFDQAPLDQKEELLRRLAESDMEHDTLGDDEFWWKDDLESCDWFDRVEGPRWKTKDISGSMVDFVKESAEVESAEVEVSDMLVPTSDSDWESVPLLVAEGEEFAFKLTKSWDDYSEGKVIVVSNGSFLVNYSLVDPGSRRLAGNLIDLCDPSGDVMFLESGRGGIKVLHHPAFSDVGDFVLLCVFPDLRSAKNYQAKKHFNVQESC